MKTTLYFALTLSIFLTLAFVSNNFAQQEALPEYVVRVIYFLPNDRQPQLDMDKKMDAFIKDVQQFYERQMEKHGFGSKTFSLETDTVGKVVVHQVEGQFNDSYYHGGTFGKVLGEIRKQFDTSQNIYLVVVDVSTEKIGDVSGQATTDGYWGGMAAIPASGVFFSHPLAAHEIGHAFGLDHDFRDSFRIMSFGPWPWGSGATELSQCNAEWLSVHRVFNSDRNHTDFDAPAEIQMHTPTLTLSPHHAIRLRFEITDPDGLHQAQLLTPLPLYNDSGSSLTACKRLKGNSNTVEFVTTDLTTELNSYVILKVIDVLGNFTSREFPIDVTSVLPPATSVSIPDSNLAAAVRETLNLSPRDAITQLDMLRLTRLNASEREIKDITGLEHATNLNVLSLEHNQIRDITPLAGLTQLSSLDLAVNMISDISPLTALTQLRFLSLYSDYLLSNKISDITPLAELTQLRVLWLQQLQISDITPLAELTQLRDLTIDANQISDITPLAGLAQLSILVLTNNQIRNINPLRELTQLEILRLSSNRISDIRPLTALTRLLELSLGRNQISDLRPLARLVNLKELRLFGNPIEDKTPLHKLLDQNPNVGIDIDVGYVPTPSDPAAAWMPDARLRSVVRGTLKLAPDDVLTQEVMQDLTVLDASVDLIKDITGLEHATQLTKLTIHNNQISDITPIAKLTALTFFSAHHNKISDITPLSNLRNLTSIILSGNQISDIAPLEKLTKLTYLHLSFNKIKNVSPLLSLVNLEELFLVRNPVTNRKPLLTLLGKNPDIKIFLKNPDEPLPVNLSYFRAEHTGAGVVLKWTTESEIDNAGFFIYRSETKEGKFKVVNRTLIQGAGTTSERNTYTWKDTTAKPNVAYYYRIADISHAGVRKQLATVRLRGFVSASGKLTTRWADLKTQN